MKNDFWKWCFWRSHRPHTLKSGCDKFSILTRLKEPNRSDIDLVKNEALWRESVEGYNSVDLEDMKKEFHDEGMSGIDPRYVINRISSTIIRKIWNPSIRLTSLRSLKKDLTSILPSLPRTKSGIWILFPPPGKSTMTLPKRSAEGVCLFIWRIR